MAAQQSDSSAHRLLLLHLLCHYLVSVEQGSASSLDKFDISGVGQLPWISSIVHKHSCNCSPRTSISLQSCEKHPSYSLTGTIPAPRFPLLSTRPILPAKGICPPLALEMEGDHRVRKLVNKYHKFVTGHLQSLFLRSQRVPHPSTSNSAHHVTHAKIPSQAGSWWIQANKKNLGV